MPEGLNHLFSAAGHQKVVSILVDDRCNLYSKDFIQIVLNNFSHGVDTGGGTPTASTAGGDKKNAVDLVLMAYKRSCFKCRNETTTVHDFNDLPSVGELYGKLLESRKLKKNSSSSVLIFDDFSLLSLLLFSRDIKLLSMFLKKIAQHFQKVFIFTHKDTISPPETAILYNAASTIAILGGVGGSGSTGKLLSCDILKIKPERRTSHEQSKFEVVKGEIIEYQEDQKRSAGQLSSNNQEVLKNLTTFKLTVEEKEKESRNRLYLPYFDAQKIDVEDSETYDDFDDEDDEEV